METNESNINAAYNSSIDEAKRLFAEETIDGTSPFFTWLFCEGVRTGLLIGNQITDDFLFDLKKEYDASRICQEDQEKKH